MILPWGNSQSDIFLIFPAIMVNSIGRLKLIENDSWCNKRTKKFNPSNVTETFTQLHNLEVLFSMFEILFFTEIKMHITNCIVSGLFLSE